MYRSRLRFVMVWAAVLPLPAGCERRPAEPGKPRIGVILMQQDQFFRLNELGMRAAAERANVDLRVQNATGALDKEMDIVDTFISQKVSAILVSPLGTQASIPALKRAHDAGIRVVTYNNAVAADFVAASVASDQEALGHAGGRAARDYIDRALGGKARVATLGFASQLPEQGGARVRGFKKGLGTSQAMTIIAEQDAWLAPQAATTVSELLTRNPDVIWAANEGGTVGAVTAVKNAGRAGRVAVFGTDVSTQLIDFLLSPDGILQAVTAQKPYEMGEAAVESAVRLLRGEAVEKNQVLPGIVFTRQSPDALLAYRRRLVEAAN